MESEMNSDDIVTLTGEAEEVITSLIHEQGYDPESAGMRISIETGGCAGLTYRFDLRETPKGEDIVCGTASATVFVDRGSKRFVEGAELGFESTAHGTGFCIDNPNADQECGCGISFRTET